MTSNPPWLWPVAIGLVLGLIVGIGLGRGTPPDPVVIFRVDSVLNESPAIRDSLRSLSREATVSKREASAFHSEAQRLRRVADSLVASGRPEEATSTIGITSPVEPDSAPVSTVPRAAYDTLAAAFNTLSYAFARQGREVALLAADTVLSRARNATLEATLRIARDELAKTKKPSRFGLGCVGGFGAVSAGGAVRTGPALACGVSYRLR